VTGADGVANRPPAEVVIGLDVGTTAAKAAGFGLGSSWRTTVVREYPLLRPRPGWEVQDPDVMSAAALGALAECVTRAEGASILGVSVGTAMHGLIGLDARLRPLTPLLTWADSRSAPQAAALRRQGVAQQLHRRSGTPVHPMSPLTKLMWFAEHEPELTSRVRAWVGLKDYVLHALTGTLVTELSSASGTGLLDLHRRTWDLEALELAGVTLEQMPPVLPTTALLGLAKSAASQVGLPRSTPVVVGAGDGPLGNVGTGALDPGVAGLSIGTSGAVRMLVDVPVVDPHGRLFCYAVTESCWAIGGAISNGGTVIRWAGEVFGSEMEGPRGKPPDAKLLALGTSVPAGSDGLVMLPYLLAERAPLWDPTLTGAFLGVRRRHTRGHFVRAAVEGVALQLSTIVDELDDIQPVTSVRATGGVFRSDLWRHVVAAVLDRPLIVTDGAEGSALGAAALGLLALGRSDTLQSAVGKLTAKATVESRPVTSSISDIEAYRQLRSNIPDMINQLGQVSPLFH
jgi:gluconokinase